MDIAFTRLHGYTSVFRSYRFHNVHIACSNVDGHIFIRSHAALAVAANRYVAGTGRHVHVVTGLHVVANRNIASTGRHVHVITGLHVVANRNIAVNRLNGYASVFRIYLLANGNIAVYGLHSHIPDNSYILVKIQVALLPRFCIQHPFGAHIIRHMQIAVLRNQVHVAARFHLAVLVNDDVLAICAGRVGCIGRMQRNIAVLR